MKKKIIIITTVSDSLTFFKGQIEVLKESFEIELVSSSGTHLREMCDFHTVKGHAIAMKREISLLNDFVSLFKLVMLFLKTKPFIVHGNTPKAGLLSMIAGRLTGIPKRIYYVHGLRYQGENGIKKEILMMMERISCFMATDIIAVSRGVRQTLEDDKICKKKVELIWNGSVNGIDLNYYDSKSPSINPVNGIYDIHEGDFVYGFIGRLVGDKGVNELVKVFDEINNTYTNCKLLLVGGFEDKLDPLNQKTLKLIQNNKNIIYVGFQKDIRPFLKMMNIFVFPSYREGFGIVLMEAGAMCVPSISSDIIGCNEIILNNKNGFLIKTKDEQELYQKMEFCVINKEKIDEMGIFSRNFFLKKYEQKKLWTKSLEFYRELSNSSNKKTGVNV